MSQPAPDPFRYDAFISYSRHDGAWVRSVLLARLERENLLICIDYRNFEIGLPSLVNMENAVTHSRKTLLALTPSWIASQWTEFESLLIQTSDPVGRGRRILPLLVEPCTLPPRLALFTYLDLTNPAEYDFQFGRLLAAIRSAPGASAPTTAPALAATSSPRPAAASGFGHERGLDALKALLAQADVETRAALATLDQRLRDNLRDERLYGTNETIRADRARIVSELNRVALTYAGRSFNELCGA